MTSLLSHFVRPIADEQARDLRVSVRWFASTDQKRDALAVRYRAYHHAGLIETSPWGIYTDEYDEIPSTLLAGLYREGNCIATLRLCYHQPGCLAPSLACETIYPEVAPMKAAATGPLVELSRLAVDPAITNIRYRTRLYAAAMRATLIACLATDVEQLLIATRLKWQKFYEYVLGFSPTGEPRFYPPGNLPIILLSRQVDSDLRTRMRGNINFVVEDAELEEVRRILTPLISGAASQTP